MLGWSQVVVCWHVYVRLAEYDNELYSDDEEMVVDIDENPTEELPSEALPQLNHVFNNEVNGDLENDLEATDIKPVKQNAAVVGSVAMRRQSSVGAASVGPVNGIRTHEHNIILQRMAIVEVKKPGKGNMLHICESIRLECFDIQLSSPKL